jgi:hypothetical protein
LLDHRRRALDAGYQSHEAFTRAFVRRRVRHAEMQPALANAFPQVYEFATRSGAGLAGTPPPRDGEENVEMTTNYDGRIVLHEVGLHDDRAALLAQALHTQYSAALATLVEAVKSTFTLWIGLFILNCSGSSER